MNIISFKFYGKLSFYLFLGFLICTIIGTVSHELGHAAVTASQGREWTIHYASMTPGKPLWYDDLEIEYKKNKDKIRSAESSPEKEAFLKFRRSLATKYKHEDLYMRLGGPMQTMIFGTIGLLFLWFGREKIKTVQQLTFTNWLLVLLTFFWSRQPAILLQKFYYTAIGNNYHGRGDEENIARHLHLNEWSVITIWGITGGIILLWVMFYIIPLQQRFTFIIAGITGGLTGALLWFQILGPMLLP